MVKPTYIGANNGKFVNTKGFYKDAATWRNLAFAASCKEIYTVSSYVFYTQNGFQFHRTRTLLEFLENIGIGGRQLLTKLRFVYGKAAMPYVSLRYLESCKKLRHLEILIDCKDGWSIPLKNPLEFFLGYRKVVEFGDCVRYEGNDDRASSSLREQTTMLRLRESLTDSLERIKKGQANN